MTDLVPETCNFDATATASKPNGPPIWQDAKNLVFQIGAATGQGDKSGYILRQYANGADPCGLIGPTCVATDASAVRSAAPLPSCPDSRVPACHLCPRATTADVAAVPTPPPLPTPPLPLPTPPHGSTPSPTPGRRAPTCAPVTHRRCHHQP